ncbi:hypothetical protein V8E55_006592 [Tylopilus felleus]
MHFVFCPLYPRTMVSIRRGWENEEAQHKLLRATWESEKQDHATLKKEWEHQRESHEKDVERRIKEEEEHQEQVRQEWSQECKRHASAIDEYDKIVARRAQEEQERQERVRENWAQEVEKQRNEWKEMERHENQRRENERQKWRREVEGHDRMKEERRKREEEERKRLNLFWGSVEAHTCSTYATREYTAQLMNLPATWDWEHRVEACRATPLEIHGISHLPITCEHKGSGIVIGRWEVNQQEPECRTFWESYDNKGCTSPGSGKKHVTQKLMNLPAKSDWKEFCATTPAHFDHMQFPGAQTCFTAIWGVYGQWELDDSNC